MPAPRTVWALSSAPTVGRVGLALPTVKVRASGPFAAQDLSCALSRAHMDCAAVGYVLDTASRAPVDTVWYSTDGGTNWALARSASGKVN